VPIRRVLAPLTWPSACATVPDAHARSCCAGASNATSLDAALQAIAAAGAGVVVYLRGQTARGVQPSAELATLAAAASGAGPAAAPYSCDLKDAALAAQVGWGSGCRAPASFRSCSYGRSCMHVSFRLQVCVHSCSIQTACRRACPRASPPSADPALASGRLCGSARRRRGAHSSAAQLRRRGAVSAARGLLWRSHAFLEWAQRGQRPCRRSPLATAAAAGCKPAMMLGRERLRSVYRNRHEQSGTVQVHASDLRATDIWLRCVWVQGRMSGTRGCVGRRSAVGGVRVCAASSERHEWASQRIASPWRHAPASSFLQCTSALPLPQPPAAAAAHASAQAASTHG
jgi:hypothetical protein